jgi:formylmethanofuran dehydrogenase subunit E-like metal-binding protein
MTTIQADIQKDYSELNSELINLENKIGKDIVSSKVFNIPTNIFQNPKSSQTDFDTLFTNIHDQESKIKEFESLHMNNEQLLELKRKYLIQRQIYLKKRNIELKNQPSFSGDTVELQKRSQELLDSQLQSVEDELSKI